LIEGDRVPSRVFLTRARHRCYFFSRGNICRNPPSKKEAQCFTHKLGARAMFEFHCEINFSSHVRWE